MKFLKKLPAFLFLTLLTPATSLAHVRYIATAEEQATMSQTDFSALFAPLSEPKYIVMSIATLIAIVFAYIFLEKNKIFHKWTQHMERIGDSYKPFIPWITRLSLGILLIGGATHNYLISPVLETPFAFLNTIQLILGFSLMAGFMVSVCAAITLILFLFALVQDPYLIGAFDVLALTLSLLALDSRKPGVDDIVGIPDVLHIKALRDYLPTILRMGVGIGMAYLAIVEKILTPHLAALVATNTELVNVIPVSAMMWAFSAGVIELAVGILLIAGWKTRLASVAAIVILSLSFFYFGEDVTSHVTLFGILSAVFILGVGKLGVDKPHTINIEENK